MGCRFRIPGETTPLALGARGGAWYQGGRGSGDPSLRRNHPVGMMGWTWPVAATTVTITCMPQSLSANYVHIVFSTRDRLPLFRDAELGLEMHRMLGGISAELDSQPIKFGGYEDHVHCLLHVSRKLSVSDWVRETKRRSSIWAKERHRLWKDFHWQAGYGVFSVSVHELAVVKAYIDNQHTHHHTMTFQEEYRALLREHGMEWDEGYVWD